jgi:hypothetical protein
VWLPVLPTDSRSEWDAHLVNDRRVINLWDPNRAVGRWLADFRHARIRYAGGVVWDAFLLFGREARWTGKLSPPLAYGSPVIETRARLEATLTRLVSRRARDQDPFSQ